jgi:type IV conjugative transfer system protein TraL
MEPVRLPNRIDEPRYFIMWRSDELIPLATLFFFGLYVDQLILCTVFGLAATVGARRFRSNQPEGVVMHAAWYFGLVPIMKGTCLRFPLLRRILP